MKLRKWRILSMWPEETVVLLGTGPSLSKEQVATVRLHRRSAHIIAVNDAYRLAPSAEVLYGCDLKWWTWHKGVTEFSGLRITQDKEAAIEYGLLWVQSVSKPGLSTDPSIIHQGSNSGYQALNLAVLMGARKVILLGFDHRAPDAQHSHFFGAHPDKVISGYKQWAQKEWPTTIPTLKQLGVDVVNCTPNSALAVFRSGDLEDEFATG